ncbi:MAG TPA: universal stress protein [Thermoanaerobaculia bacterium]|jgi:nucleotide-binding universal stress UspA family protein|nr:universal stress protein [Thermoanaerobaculia bacterium]
MAARRRDSGSESLFPSERRELVRPGKCDPEVHAVQGVATPSAFDVQAEATVRQAASPLDGILMEARKGDYDLVVIGSHGPRARSRTGRDDVTLQILDNARRPVLIVPEDTG